MLGFFRKYQKIFFVFVTVVIVISFSFFGTFSTVLRQDEMSDREIGTAIDGSKMSHKEVELMKRFLKNNYEEGGKAANLLNDSVIYKNFLLSDMARILAERYFDWIKPDLQERIRKAKFYTGYVHPQAPSINAQEVWATFHPRTKILLDQLKAADENNPTLKDFSLLCELYLAQTEFSPQILKQILLYQQNQYSWIKPDPALYHQEHYLFNYQSIENWFGPKFLDVVSQFILNAALISEQKGYHVTKDEARAELILNVYRLFQAENRGKQISLQDAQNYYYHQIVQLGMDEANVIKIWQKIAYFRRMFDEAGKGAFLDKLALDQFHSYSKELAKVEGYHLQSSLRLNDFCSLLKFQLYLEAVSGKDQKGNPLDLPKNFLSAETVEKHFPELVQKRFLLEFAEAKKDQLALQITLKETWDWQLDEAHFALMQKEFPVLAGYEVKTREQRYQALEKVDPHHRAQMDRFSRLKIVDERPQWIADALAGAQLRKEVIAIQMQGATLPFEGVTEVQEFIKLLEKQDGSLSHFSGDGQTFYSIKVLEQSDGKEVLTFEEASKAGILEGLMDQHLEAAYPVVRKKQASKFLAEDGSWKPFDEVKDQIGQTLYKDLMQAIEESCREEIDNQSLNSLDFYASHRFCHYMKQVKEALIGSSDHSLWILQNPEKQEDQPLLVKKPLARQWLLIIAQEEMLHQNKQNSLADQTFHLNEGDWSKVYTKQNGDLSFYRLVQKSRASLSDKEISESQKVLALEAQRYLMRQVLDAIGVKNAIHLAQNSEE